MAAPFKHNSEEPQSVPRRSADQSNSIGAPAYRRFDLAAGVASQLMDSTDRHCGGSFHHAS